MSKIENALAKARGQIIPLKPQRGAGPGQDMVALKQRPPNARDMAVAATALARMEEPWLLDEAALEAKRIIHPDTADPEVVMVFRDLRTKILQRVQENCTIMVSSVGKGADTAFVATNLAVAFALDDSKTSLLVDCSFSAPMFEHLVSSHEACGITDYLKNESVALEQIIHPIGVRRMRVIPTGRSYDQLAEYFTLHRMRQLLNELRERYPDRYIVLGAPPIADSAGANVLADLADYAILFVPYGAATESDVREAAGRIDANKLVGVVFTDFPELPMERRRLSGWLLGFLPFRRRRRVAAKRQ